MTDTDKIVPFDEHQQVVEKLDKTTARAQRFEGKLTDLERQLEQFKGVDLEGLKAAKEELEILRKQQATKSPDDLEAWKKEEAEKIKNKVLSQTQSEIERLSTELATKDQILTELTVVDKVTNEIGENFNSDVMPFVKDIIRKRVKKNEDGEYVVLTEDGEPMYVSGKPATPQNLVDEIGSKHASFLKRQVSSGSKMNGTRTETIFGGDKVAAYAKMTPEQRKANLSRDERGKLASELLKQASPK